MRAFTISSILLGVIALAGAQSNTVPVTGVLGNATVTENNPIGVVYRATLPDKAFTYPGPQGNVKGYITGTAGPGGTGVSWSVNFSNLPASGGPFLYHVHVARIPDDGNCTAALAHLDPFIRGEVPPCNPALPETCQVGDLGGKHGSISSDPWVVNYVDSYTSSREGLGSFFGNRSLVVHFANTTRITCANFELVSRNGNGTNNGNGTVPTSRPVSPPTSTSTPSSFPFVPKSDAAGNMASTLSVLALAGLTAFFL